MKDEQLEIRFEDGRSLRPSHHRQRRHTRAAWWFAQMRRAVDLPGDKRSATPAEANRLAAIDLARA